MALTTTQINQAYIAVLGRAALGNEPSLIAPTASISDVAAALIAGLDKADAALYTTLVEKVVADAKDAKLNNADFVESLYSTLLNRESDEEGKAFWLNTLNNGMSREELVAQFTNAVISQPDSADFAAYSEQVAIQADNFVESLYTKLLGRDSDEAGKAYWSQAIANGASYAEVAANFAAAAASQGNSTEDGLTIAKKLAVADYYTNKIQSYNQFVTESGIKTIQDESKSAIEGITAESSADDIAVITEKVDQLSSTYTALGSTSFTKDANDVLGVNDNGEYNTTKATNFTGTVNLDDPTKGTIQTTDKVYGNPEFADGNAITINVTGTTTTKTFALPSVLPTVHNNISNLAVKSTGAQVTGNITENFKNLSIQSGLAPADQFAANITIKSEVENYTAGAKADQLTVASGAKVGAIDMGAGNDTIVLQSGAGSLGDGMVINGGAGTNTLNLAATASATNADYDIASISNIKTIALTASSTGHSAKIAYDAIKDSNLAFNLTSDNGSGDLTIKAGDNTTIDVSKIANGVASGSTTIKEVESLTIEGVKNNSTITLEAAATGNKLVDNIDINNTASTGEFAAGGKVAIKNFGISGAGSDSDVLKFNAAAEVSNASGDLSGAVHGVASIKVANGVVTFYSDASGTQAKAVTLNSLNDVLDVLADSGAQGKLANNSTVAVNIGSNAYVINVGATKAIDGDEIIIELINVKAGELTVASNDVTIA